MAVEVEIEKWLRRELTKHREKAIKLIILRHATPGAKGNDVETIDLSERTSLEIGDLQEIADDLCGRAQVDTDGMGGIQRYVISLHPEGEKRAVGRYPFRLRANLEEFEEAGEEPANTRGLLSQLMRHNEALAKTMVHAVSGITTVMARRLESSDNAISRLTEAQHRNMALLEEAKSEQHVRDMELLKENSKQERTDKIFEKLSLLVPVVINKLAGQKVFNSDDPSALMLKSFAESMSPEQFQKIQATLSPEQMLVLGQLLTGVKALPSGNAS